MKLGLDNSTVEVEVVLGRRLIGEDYSTVNMTSTEWTLNYGPVYIYTIKGTFMTIYMPTILLNIIGHSTNYFKPLFFEAVVTVNLTVNTVLRIIWQTSD